MRSPNTSYLLVGGGSTKKAGDSFYSLRPDLNDVGIILQKRPFRYFRQTPDPFFLPDALFLDLFVATQRSPLVARLPPPPSAATRH
jgi:hypothetical protein